MKTVYRIYDPDTNECVQELEEDRPCRAQRGLEPMNEACGGCTECLLMQARHAGWIVKESKE